MLIPDACLGYRHCYHSVVRWFVRYLHPDGANAYLVSTRTEYGRVSLPLILLLGWIKRVLVSDELQTVDNNRRSSEAALFVILFHLYSFLQIVFVVSDLGTTLTMPGV